MPGNSNSIGQFWSMKSGAEDPLNDISEVLDVNQLYAKFCGNK